ncbi:hypothetical protein SUGI_0815420 [Cryptomeria japonica]|nr:hypothetical protein SUGI_0815420 [Cryptomeria japonica]
MAFKSFVGNSGPVAPPKKSISFGSSDQSPPRPSNIPGRTSPSPPRSRPKPRNSPSPPHEALKPRPRARSSSPTPPPLNDDEHQREIEAKARRLARFNTELSEPIRSSSPPLGRQQQQQQQQQLNPLQKKEVDETMDCEDSEPILGSCPDMCPESERGERERKGDLDKFERLHGDRNLTDKSLAVKKYNRTAEREASLIRPLPVLQMTMDHILTLIDRSYDDEFLSIYNFLWDRMRAIRMDLRIQHIFNQDAITMHEQMIRFHIVAMHELCEYTKGEGFSEGFDAHLNIEQMNKASVELFQMYDDHRKRGNPILTEQEFRGYYALLKLDKHPGYKVEPAELSLDLAKMTSEMRNTKEVLFAREVARASRSGNYIAFFRLARRATYLQACLMHAHFAKLRTQALASLHSGLQKNQGIPAAQVVKWLAMEGEDTEGLFEYHGFSLKQFEDLYMVKEGPFLNGDVDFQTKCSQLVHQKRSDKILHDVISPGQVPEMDGTLQTIRSLDAQVDKLSKRAIYPNIPAFNSSVPPEEEMPDYEEDVLPIDGEKFKDWEMQEPFGSQQTKKFEEADKLEMRSPRPIFGGEPVIPRSGARKHTIHQSKPLQEQRVKKLRRNVPELELEIKKSFFPLKEHFGNFIEREDARGPIVHDINEMHRIETVKDWTAVEEPNDQDEKAKLAIWKAEVEVAKLKLLLRRWKRQASKIAESRHMRRLKANAALNSLLVGPPVRSNKKIVCHEERLGGIQNLSMVELNIDQIVRERYNMHTRMWSKLDVPEVIGPILSQKNPQAMCLCWKLVLCSRIDDKSCTNSSQIVGQWLRFKMMGNDKTDREQSSVSISEVATTERRDSNRLFCLSILRDVSFNVDRLENEEASLGASGLLFLLVDKVHWDLERGRLQSLVGSVKPGSCLPLLILSSVNVEISTIENQLELQKLDRMRIGSWSVILVTENEHDNAKGFLSDDCLRKGLLWLADHAPQQPNVYPSDVRNLVLESLEPYLNILLNANPLEVTPGYCIHAFNQALNETESDIVLAAQNSLPGWPAPEIKDLDVRVEGGYLESYMPKSGWNMGFNIDAIVHALRLCRLPELSSFDLNPIFCGVGSQEFGDEIQERKLTLQKYLYQYLCQISFANKGDLLTLKEADLMVQNHTACECINSRHVIVPEWATIFRRIYNWQLMLLESEPAAIVYVSRPRKIGLLVDELKQHLLSSVRQIFMTSDRAYQVTPSLNEMLESSCKVISRGPSSESSVQTVKDQYQQHAKNSSPESMVKNAFIDFANNSYGQQKFASRQNNPLMEFSESAEHIAMEVESQIPDSDEVRHQIEFGQTDGELQLNQVLTDFCEKVNEQKQRIASLIEETNMADCSPKLNRAPTLCISKEEKSAYKEIRRSQGWGFECLSSNAIDCRSAVSLSPRSNSNAMDKLSNLLEQCSAVQISLDKKLVGHFGEK